MVAAVVLVEIANLADRTLGRVPARLDLISTTRRRSLVADVNGDRISDTTTMRPPRT